MPSRPAPTRPLRTLLGFVAITVLAVSGVAVAAPASAAGETLNVTLSQKTGTGPFDADDAAGHDSSDSNDVVRTNDTVTYTVGIRYEGGDQTAPHLTFTLPQGEGLVSLPPFCLPGSTLTPATLPDPVVPTTATSWTSLPAQAIDCLVAPQSQGTSLNYDFLSKVRPEVPNGTVLGPVSVSATTDQVTTPATSENVQHTVSAAAQFDVSKRLTSTSDTSGPFYQYSAACSFDSTRACFEMDFPLTINAPSGGKGITPLASPIIVTEDLSPDAFFGAGTTASAAWTAAGAGALDKYAPRLSFCNGGIANLHAALPNPSGGSATNTDSVRNSGSITCAQTSLGTPVDIVITDADTTAFTVPSLSQDGLALPADAGLVVSTTVRIELPIEAITDLGTSVDGVSNLDWRNTYTNVVATDIAGNPNEGEDPSNNTRAGNTNVRSTGSFDKVFSGVTGDPGNTLTTNEGAVPTGYTAYQFEGPPGSSFAHDGNTVVLPGQTVLSNLYSLQNIPVGTGTQFSTSKIVCDVWDDTKLGMPSTFDFPDAGGSTVVRLPSGGSPVWISGFHFTSPAYDADISQLANLSIQYSSTPTPGSGADSDCSTGTWYDSAAAVPGATVVDGLWQGVNRVRVSFSTRSASDQEFGVNASIALTVLDTAGPQGTILPNWASTIESQGVIDRDAVLADPDATKQLSSYDPATNEGGKGDRLIVGQAVARIKKFVKNPDTGDYTDTAVPQYTAGSNIDYRLNPSLTASSAADGSFGDVLVEDCLPQYQSFVSSSRESGAPITPVVTQLGSPAGAGITCAANETYVKWDLGQNEINAAIDPILYTVEVLATVRNGLYTNTTLVTSAGDPSPASARTDTAQVQIVVPTGIKIAKSVDKPVVDVTPDGATTPRGFTWTIDFANIDSPQNVSDADVIDVLPANGIGGTHFTGSLELVSVTPAGATTGVATLYTADPSADLQVDPSDPSNGATGSTVWCDAATGGAVVSGSGSAADCPTSLADVTGLRFLRAGEFTPTDAFTIAIAMAPSGNSAADVYENRTSGRVVGVSQPVGPAVRDVTVVSSSIGDYVWNDVNGNGIQDAGEPGIAGFPVTLTGTDVDGNPITASTTTDAAGNYLFTDLPSGTYTVTFDPAGLGSTYAFTQYKQGADGELDSDADVTTGEAAAVTLGQDEQRLDVDAGLTRLQTASIILTKVVVDPDTSDEAGDATSFPVTITCTVPENPTPIVIDTTVAADRTPTEVTGLPVGATCVIAETDTDGAVVTYSVENGTITTIGEPVDVTITNTFPGTSVAKQVVGAPVKNADGSYAITYDVTVSNTGKVDTVYTVEDELHYGAGIVVDTAEITDSPDGVDVNDSWNGVTDLVIAEDVDIPVDGVHVYRVVVTATVPTTVTTGARNCEVGTGETGTGFLNSATVVTDRGETTASDCAPAPEEPVVPVAKPATGSLPNTGANVTIGLAALLGLMLAGGVALVISRRRRVD